MPDRARRKELQAQYRENPPEAGVYRIVNTQNEKVLLSSATNLASVRNKLKFAKSTGSVSTLDHRLEADANEFGIDVFTLEVLDTIDVGPELTRKQIEQELAELEALYRQEQDPALMY